MGELQSIARKFGTPAYVYSKSKLIYNAKAFQSAFAGYPTLSCFALKANNNPEILKELKKLGFGADIVSMGELEIALKAGISADRIVYSSVGKRDEEIEKAVKVGIYAFNVESAHELFQIENIASKLRKAARISFRVNPNIDAKTHPYITTGLYSTKFGISEKELFSLLSDVRGFKHAKLVGLSTHIGSQITTVRPFRDAARRMALLAGKVVNAGFPLEFIDMGGGIGIQYMDEKIPKLVDFANAIIPEIKKTGLRLLLEPGRIIVGNAGVLLTRVISVKKSPRKTFVIVDAGMNDLIRPALYGAHHPIGAVEKRGGRKAKVDIVGPVCESADCFGEGRLLPELRTGDLLTIGCAGAYGYTMASNYNARPLPAEIVVK